MGQAERYKSSKKVREVVEMFSPKRKNVIRSLSDVCSGSGALVNFGDLVSLSSTIPMNSEQALTFDTLPATLFHVKFDDELVAIEEEKELNKLLSDLEEYTKDWDFPTGHDYYIYDYRVKV